MIWRPLHAAVLLAGLIMMVAPLGATRTATAEIVRDAIARQRVLRVRYSGLVRFVEPHALGVTPGGHRAVLVWQVSGGSRSDPPTGWRTFLLSEITALASTVQGFERRSDYNRERAGLRDLEIEVSAQPNASTDRPVPNQN